MISFGGFLAECLPCSSDICFDVQILSSKASQARRAKLEKVKEERDKVEFNKPRGLFLLTLANGFISLDQVRERLASMKKEAEAAEEGREETEERAEVKLSEARNFEAFAMQSLHSCAVPVILR